eukprot:8661283-Pyramimonas_sp.AAC.1
MIFSTVRGTMSIPHMDNRFAQVLSLDAMGPQEESAYTALENSSMACARAHPSRRSGMDPRAYSCRPGAPARSAGIAARP